MQGTERYVPGKDTDRFIGKSILKLMGVLSRIRGGGKAVAGSVSAPLLLAGTLYLIILCACARNAMFLYAVLAVVLVRSCFLPGRDLKGIVLTALPVSALTAVLLLPAVFLGSPRTMLTVALKVFLSVMQVGILSHTVPWNRLTAGLRFYHVPDLFILTMDLAIKFIAILGETALEALTALKLRSVGKNRQKGKTLGGIPGTVYLKARALSEETYGAMRCRCFDGTYQRRYRGHWTVRDTGYAVLLALLTGIFIWLEVH